MVCLASWQRQQLLQLPPDRRKCVDALQERQGRLHVSVWLEAGEVVIQFADSGRACAIPGASSILFTPQTRRQSTGLGLSAAYG